MGMAMRWSYIGALGPDGALDWGGTWSGNIPTSGLYLPDWEDLKLYLQIRGHAREGKYGGDQVDWGAYAIRVNGPEMLTILAECYTDLGSVDPESLLGRYIAFARDLGSNEHVALVACAL
jgi:hypothetical protein